MPSYSAPVKDIKFILQNVLKIHDSEIPGYGDLDNEYLSAILEEASKISSEVHAVECHWRQTRCSLKWNSVYSTRLKKPQSTKGRMDWYDCDIKFGGQGLPYLISIAVARCC